MSLFNLFSSLSAKKKVINWENVIVMRHYKKIQ